MFSAVLQPETAINEHKQFVKTLKDQGIKVVQLVDLTAQTYDKADAKVQDQFIEDWLNQADPVISDETIRAKLKKYLKSFTTKDMIRKMMSGILARELKIEQTESLIVNPMPNLYFTRDPWAAIGNGVSINAMKYTVRKRELLFTNLIFTHNTKYKNTPRYFDFANDEGLIEGGDIFIYNTKTLVIGKSERTNLEAIMAIAKNIKANPDCKFEKIVAINVPPMPNLMHLDT